MAVRLGRPKVSLQELESFMKADKEKELFSMFQSILEERRDKEKSHGQNED